MFGHWYVVSNQVEARVFTESSVRGKLKLVKLFKNDLAQEKRRALIRKEAGQGVLSAGHGKSSHQYIESLRRDPKEEAAEQFSKKLADFLDKMAVADAYQTLTVVAEPHFLGKIRSSMSGRTKKRVGNWMRKDINKKSQADIAKALGLKFDRPKLK